MTQGVRFALNHITAPRRRFAGFLDLACELGVTGVEIRNDLPGVEIADGNGPAVLRDEAATRGVEILTINALYPFDVWCAERAAAAADLADYAAACGARALVLCPLNTTDDRRGSSERGLDLRRALQGLAPILADRDLRGFVEPLGFMESALRTKRTALEAIRDVGGQDRFALLHDTFHHHLAGEAELFPEETGLVHVSGVNDAALPLDAMRDEHRVLVDRGDRLGNIEQIRALRAGGYAGPFSFEPFASSVHELADPAAALRASMAVVAEAV